MAFEILKKQYTGRGIPGCEGIRMTFDSEKSQRSRIRFGINVALRDRLGWKVGDKIVVGIDREEGMIAAWRVPNGDNSGWSCQGNCFTFAVTSFPEDFREFVVNVIGQDLPAKIVGDKIVAKIV